MKLIITGWTSGQFPGFITHSVYGDKAVLIETRILGGRIIGQIRYATPDRPITARYLSPFQEDDNGNA